MVDLELIFGFIYLLGGVQFKVYELNIVLIIVIMYLTEQSRAQFELKNLRLFSILQNYPFPPKTK